MRGPDHIVEFLNDAHRRVFNSADWLGKTTRDAFPSLEGQGLFEKLDEVFSSGKTFEAQGVAVRFRREPGSPEQARYLTFIYAPVYDSSNVVTGIFCERFDVTETYRARKRSAAIAELGNAVRLIENPEDLAYAAAEIIGRELEVSRAGYGTIDLVEETISIERVDAGTDGADTVRAVGPRPDVGGHFDFRE